MLFRNMTLLKCYLNFGTDELTKLRCILVISLLIETDVWWQQSPLTHVSCLETGPLGTPNTKMLVIGNMWTLTAITLREDTLPPSLSFGQLENHCI